MNPTRKLKLYGIKADGRRRLRSALIYLVKEKNMKYTIKNKKLFLSIFIAILVFIGFNISGSHVYGAEKGRNFEINKELELAYTKDGGTIKTSEFKDLGALKYPEYYFHHLMQPNPTANITYYNFYKTGIYKNKYLRKEESKDRHLYLLTLPQGATIKNIKCKLSEEEKNGLRMEFLNQSKSNVIFDFAYASDEQIEEKLKELSFLENSKIYKRKPPHYSGETVESIFPYLISDGMDKSILKKDVKSVLATYKENLILIQIKEPTVSSAGAEKGELKKKIDETENDISGENENKWYHDNDRVDYYKGELTYDYNGFWNTLKMYLRYARAVYEDKSASSEEISDALESLSLAREKIISKDRINPNDLYHYGIAEHYGRSSIHETYCLLPDQNPPNWDRELLLFNEKWAIKETWEPYAEARAEALELWNKLYDNGKPTAFNSSKDGSEAQLRLKQIMDKLIPAVNNIDATRPPTEVDETTIEIAQAWYKSCGMLLKRFRPDNLNPADYTEESWTAFINGYKEVEEAYSALRTPGANTGWRNLRKGEQCDRAMRKLAFDTLVSSKDNVEITVNLTDNRGALSKTYSKPIDIPMSNGCGSYKVTLPKDKANLEEALIKIYGEDYGEIFKDSMSTVEYSILFYRNDICESIDLNRFDDTKVRDGDNITLALSQTHSTVNAGGAQFEFRYHEALPYVRYQTFFKEGNQVSEIEEPAVSDMSLNVMTSLALPTGLTGLKAPLEGTTIYRTKCCKTKDDALKSVPEIDTGIVTDADGKFTISLPSDATSNEGWYMINAIKKARFGGYINGPSLLVRVVDPDDISGIKAELKQKAETLINSKPGIYYNEEQTQLIEDKKKEAFETIDNAKSSGEAKAAYDKLVEMVMGFFKENDKAINEHKNGLEKILPNLPSNEDIAAGKVYKFDKNLLEFLFGMTGMYNEMTEYEKSILESADRTRLEALERIYKNTNYGKDLPVAPQYGLKLEAVDSATGEKIDEDILNYKGQSALTFKGNKYVDAETNKVLYGLKVAEPVNLKIGDVVYADPQDVGELTYKIISLDYSVNEGYVIDGINWNGNEDYLEAKRTSSGVNFSISTRALRDNVTVQIYVSKTTAGNYENDLNRLKSIYLGFNQSRYSSDNWKKIKDLYYKSVQAINNSKTKAERNSIISRAKYDMDKVKKLDKDEFGTVHVTVRNDTFTSDAAAFKGLIVDKMIPLEKDDTMMKAILKALDSSGFTWKGTGGDTPTDTEITYLSSIHKDGKKLGEFDGGASSGWMGTLNDWFTNEGFAQFGVKNGKLSDGDEISVEYTCELGRDIRGGFEGNTDTALFELNLSNGSMNPHFNPDIKEYYFVLNEGETRTTLDYSARVRSFPARAYLNEYKKDDKYWINPGDNITVQAGDTIYVVVGEQSWPSMGKGSPTMYKVNIATRDSSNLATMLISQIPNVEYSNYKANLQKVKDARNVYDSLSDEAKSRVRDYDKLTKAEGKIELYQKLDEFKSKLSEVKSPADLNNEDEAGVVELINQYDSLDSMQKAALNSLELSKIGSLKKWVDDNHNKYKLVIEKIKAIGDVTLEKEEQIKDARAAYELLSDEQKKLVNNYPDLVAAENQIVKLKEQKELETLKETAKTQLEEYKNIEDYRDEEKKLLAEAVKAGKEAIGKAKTKAQVEEQLANAKAEIDKIKTDAQLTELEREAAQAVDDKIDSIEKPITVESKNQIDEARAAYEKLTDKEKTFVNKLSELEAYEEAYEEALKTQELDKVKGTLKKQLEEYKDPELYREAEKKKLAEEVEKGKLEIGRAKDADAAGKAFDAAKKAIDDLNLKTAAEYEQEELAEFKEKAKKQLAEYKNADDYRDAERKLLDEAIQTGKEAIENAKTKAEAEEELTKAKAELDKIKTDAQLTELAKAKAKAMDDKIAAIKAPVLFDMKEKIESIRGEYDKLSDEEKSYVKKLNHLKAAEKEVKLASRRLDFIKVVENNEGNNVNFSKDNASFIEKSAKGLKYELDTDFSNFGDIGKVTINGKELKRGVDYEAKSGSVIIDFSKEFLDSLTVGNYTALIMTKDGYGEFQIQVLKKEDAPIVDNGNNSKPDANEGNGKTKIPKNSSATATGDSSNVLPYGIITMVGISLSALIFRKKYFSQKRMKLDD